MKYKWLLFDSRYRHDTERASVFEVCDSLKEAEENAPEYGEDTVIVEFQTKGSLLENPKIIN